MKESTAGTKISPIHQDPGRLELTGDLSNLVGRGRLDANGYAVPRISLTCMDLGPEVHGHELPNRRAP
jgi:hypothetical protein